ncbi:MAG: response regulator, partial [Clostridiales bacterium]|nr:response regulator [Clostridiales bacterium]
MEKAHGDRKHVLIVDDDSGVLKLLRGYLAERYDVATAISGKIALKFLESKKTDLVLLDYEMPGENGADVLKAIRSNPATQSLPVVFLTGLTDKDKIQEVLSLNPQGYLLKPIEMDRLASTIKGIIHQ